MYEDFPYSREKRQKSFNQEIDSNRNRTVDCCVRKNRHYHYSIAAVQNVNEVDDGDLFNNALQLERFSHLNYTECNKKVRDKLQDTFLALRRRNYVTGTWVRKRFISMLESIFSDSS